MRFLTTLECNERARQAGINSGKNRIQLTKPARHFVQLAYQSRMMNADAVASTPVECLGTYDWAVLWAYELPSGDRSREATPPLDWRDYAQWRLRQDEHRSLYDAPGHEFAAGDCGEVVELTQAAIYMGWDARAFSSPFRCVIDLSHDDIVTLRSSSNLFEVTARLIQLGLTQISTANRRRL